MSLIPAHNVVVELPSNAAKPGMYILVEGNSLLLSVEYFQRFSVSSMFSDHYSGTYVSEITASKKSACAWLAVC